MASALNSGHGADFGAPAAREPEIDGLRALAVLAVVLFHAGIPGLGGGFAGVDVFFVLSGYLITGIIQREIDSGGFSVLGFYERRARRIVPAFFAVVATVSVLVFIAFPPQELIRYAESLISASLFVSNFYFYRNTGYFQPAAETFPLLHTWSLAVEEQFYIFFPVLFQLLWKRPRLARLALLGIAILSLVLSVVLTRGNSAFAFYLPFTRIWELLAGSLLALRLVPAVQSPMAREWLSGMSLVLMLGSFALLGETESYPSWWAALPVLGAAGLIHAARGTRVGRVLSGRPLVQIGLISYSLYLWHWPLLVLASAWLLRPLALWESSLIVALSAGLAALSWRFVEQPFRNRSFLRRPQVLAGSALAFVLLALVGLSAIMAKGFPDRMSPEVRRLEAFGDDVSPRRADCHDIQGSVPIAKACVLGAQVPPSVAVWSDSHGVELAYALGEIAAGKGKSVLQLSSSSCGPSADVGGERCRRRNRDVLDFLLRTPTIRSVILIQWRRSDELAAVTKSFAALEPIVSQLRAAGRTVALEYPVYDDVVSVPERLAREQWFSGTLAHSAFPFADYTTSYANSIRATDTIVASYGLVPVRPTDVLCDRQSCYYYKDGKVLLFDTHHLSLSAARMVAPLYASLLDVQ